MTSRSIGYMDCFSGVWAGLLAWENSAERHEPSSKIPDLEFEFNKYLLKEVERTSRREREGDEGRKGRENSRI